jgi:hypothetical protein
MSSQDSKDKDNDNSQSNLLDDALLLLKVASELEDSDRVEAATKVSEIAS